MATAVQSKHLTTGLTKTGYFGFSWTTLIFGPFPALFRGDFITFIGYFFVLLIIAFATAGLGIFVVDIIWAFMYNKYYTRRLLERGYVLSDTAEKNEKAAHALGVALPPPVPSN
jgi:hypothetical protein